jgi:hypothetical protein
MFVKNIEAKNNFKMVSHNVIKNFLKFSKKNLEGSRNNIDIIIKLL